MIVRSALVAGIVFALSTATAVADCMNSDPFYWEGDRRLSQYDTLMKYMQCKDYGNKPENALADKTACNWFVARGLQDLFDIDDFTPDGGGWKTANDIAAHVSSSSDWELVGAAKDQATLEAASTSAADGTAVIAVSAGAPHGHVAIVLAGPLAASGSWKLNVPNSASFFLGEANRTYVGCKLSYAWSSPDGVSIYKRAK